MNRIKAFGKRFSEGFDRLLYRMGLGLQAKLIIIFLVAKVIPLIVLTLIAWRQINILGSELREIAVTDSSAALNQSAVENIERMTTDTAMQVADFLYGRDEDILFAADLPRTEADYRSFLESRQGRLMQTGEWALAEDGQSWVQVEPLAADPGVPVAGGVSNNTENNDMDGFHYRAPDEYVYRMAPLYDEITFVDLNGVEQIKVVAEGSTKVNHPLDAGKRDVSDRMNTFVRAEDYFEKLQAMAPGEIYVSDVIGAYTPSNYIGMYTPDNVAAAAEQRGYPIEYDPEAQSYAGLENPNGERFEGIVRFATPVADESGDVIGYVTLALNHDHIMEFVDHQTPMNERYTELPSAYEGNYAFIWDYQCRSICHPRHNSIVGYDAETGDPQIPWLESSIYDAWQASGVERWTDFIVGWPTFDHQSRAKTPAPALTRAGLVGLDGRYLNNAPQCTGWMDLTVDGGSGSFYILWSGLYKLTTAAAIPYYTGQYAPSEANGFSRRGFGIVTIGAGLEDFTRPARETEEKLGVAIRQNLATTSTTLIATSAVIIVLVVLIAIWIASSLTGQIKSLIAGISRFRAGERQFRFDAPIKNEFGTLADSFDDMADSIVDSVKNPLTIIGMDGRIIYMNGAGLAFTHMTLDDAVGRPYSEYSVYPPDSRFNPITALEEGFEAEAFLDPDSQRYLKGNADYLLDKDGKRIGYIVITQDITDMVRERNVIEEQRTLLDRIFSASPDMIWYMDAHGVYVTVNPRFAAITGEAPEAFQGRTAVDMLPGALAEGFAQNDRAAIDSHKPLYSEEHVTFADGHAEILDAVRTPVFDTTGQLVGLLGFARDVSARVTIEDTLRHTQLELEKAVTNANTANEHKGEFLARMSHEIRTPMNAIIGLSNVVQRKLGTPAPEDPQSLTEVREHVQQIEVSSQHLLGLLNDILDISKIEAGKIELTTDETMEIGKLGKTVAGIIAPRCEEKNIHFVTAFDRFEPSTFKADALRLRQVLINLLGNAVKFTPELGTIEFIIKRLDQRDGRTLMGFTVRDNGIGIAPERMETIFQPFEQGNRKISRQYGGTGLGLSISRSIVQLFGGDIRVDSVPGEGSAFSFDIWLTETAPEKTAAQSEVDLTGRFAGKRALLVDDVDINRMIVLNMLEITGMQIDEAEDGDVAVRMFAEAPEGTYDIVFMDVLMPNMDGYEAARAIRAMDRPDAKTTPIITLTANAFQDDIDKAHAAGMDAHITKPVDMDKLMEILVQYL